MSDVRQLHNRAMELAQLAIVAREKGEGQKAEDLARQAYGYEAQAADLIPEAESSEPTRSILYRSAASLAYQCKELQIAQRLIAKGLSGHPPPQVEQELKDLWDQVNFEYHLQEQNVVLEDDDLQLSMLGRAVGSGMILYDEFTKRIGMTISLINRTVQRKMGREYQRRGAIAKQYKPFIPALSTPRAGSFSITLKLVRPEESQLSYWTNAAQIIAEIISGIEFLNNADDTSLREMIQDDAYHQHFLVSTRQIAPDGDQINFVSFATKGRVVGLTRRRSEFEFSPALEDDADKSEMRPITVEGVLDYAKSRKKNVIQLTPEEGDRSTITVQEGMDDVVRSYYGEWVVVTGVTDGVNIYLKDIQAGEG